MARAIIRGRIPDTPEVRRLLQERTPETRFEVAVQLRELAEPFRIDLDNNHLELLKYVRSWGYLAPDQDPREVRQTLVDTYSLLTEYIPLEDDRGRREPPAIRQRKQGTFEEKYPDPDTEPSRDPDQPPGEINLDSDQFEVVRFLPSDISSLGVDTSIMPISYTESARHWSSAKFGAPTFGTAGDAMALVGVQKSRHALEEICSKFDGTDVNVVIADVGINEDHLRQTNPGVNYAGGFISSSSLRPLPGTFYDPMQKPMSWHGNLIARNVLRCAPNARIFDAPLLPNRVTSISGFTYDVEQLYLSILWERFLGPFKDQPWVIVNAWAVADSLPETRFGLPEESLYSRGHLHPTNILLQVLGRNLGKNSLDIVFAAGNSGEFAPDTGTGIYDSGPDQGIKGANALSGVLTVGACDVTGRWIGASSQGDGPDALKYGVSDAAKPDLCAPSWFSDTDDAAALNTGSSAACGVAAGIVASLRTTERTKPSADLFRDLRTKAVTSTDHNMRTGAGRIAL